MMDWKNIIEWTAIITWFGGILSWMISYHLVIRYTRKNLSSLSELLYGRANYYSGNLSMYEMQYINNASLIVLINYHFFYKKNRQMKGLIKGQNILYVGLDNKNAILIYQRHYKWIILNMTSFILGAVWLFGSGFFIFWAKQIGG